MTTLQRSSISFRRQGSSGLIWDDHLRVLEPKSTVPSPTSPSLMTQELHLPTPERNGDAKLTENTTPESGLPNSSSPPQERAQRCSLSSIFGRCMGSPAIQGQFLNIFSLKISIVLLLFCNIGFQNFIVTLPLNHYLIGVKFGSISIIRTRVQHIHQHS